MTASLGLPQSARGTATPRGVATPRDGAPASARMSAHSHATLALSSGCPSGGGALLGLKSFMPMIKKGEVKVPFLPGYSSGEITPAKKKQTLTYGPGGAHDTLSGMQGYSTENAGLPKLDLQSLETMCTPSARSGRSITHEEREAARESARNTYKPAIPPAWLKHDRQVLRFAAFFKEPVHENPKENFRIRHCTIYFYLEDGTMMITEPKVENSGIPQGTFVKRHRIPKADGSHYVYQDLANEQTITVYSRAFRIYDCDDFTREFIKTALGVTLPSREEPPLDSFRASQLCELDMLAQPKNRDIVEGKEYNELFVGGSRKNRKLQQYLENDRKVLSFKAFWDDPTKYGARMYYQLHYHLADDTVEMLECLARNSGRDPYPVFWRRSELRKNPHINPTPGMIEPEADLYKPEDMIVGSTIKVYGRDIFLYDCDDFTRDFYRGYMGVEQDKMEIRDAEVIHSKLSHPPHTGFGTDEDSLASCLRLRQRPPRRDVSKLIKEDGNVMRFEGKMMNGATEDTNRRFVVAMHLADDTIGIWEKRQRNSGHAEGKFALKSRKKNSATGDWFKPQDFFLGAVVEINSMPFALVGADAATVASMEEKCDMFPVANINAILGKLGCIKGALSQVSKEEITDEEFHGLANDCGVDLCLHEIITVVRKFGKQDETSTRGTIETAKLFAAL